MKFSNKLQPAYTLLLAGITLSSCGEQKEKAEVQSTFVLSKKMAETTETAVAQLEPVLNEQRFYGKITADANRMVEIFPVVGGSVTQVPVELGDYVHRGQLLARIRSTEVAGFEKDLADAENDVLVERNNAKVTQEMFDGKLASERDLIEAKSRLDKALSQLTRIRETYKIYNIRNGAMYDVLAPLDGYIIQKNINEGMLLRSDKTDNIFDIADIKDVWAIANVNETDIDQVKLGISAEVSTLSYPDKIYNGQVDKIFNVIDPETKAMKVRIKLNNPDDLLKPEMRANIVTRYEEQQKMICIPSEAVIFDRSKNFVMVFKNAQNIETREVEIFRRVGDKTYVAQGLQQGEKVITRNRLLIYDALND